MDIPLYVKILLRGFWAYKNNNHSGFSLTGLVAKGEKGRS